MVSMTGTELENLLNSSYGYFENKMSEVDYPCVEPPFVLTKAEAGDIEDERVALSRIELDSSIKKMENWVKDVLMKIKGENADKVFAEIFSNIESPPIVSKSILDVDVLKQSDGDGDTRRENIVELEDENKTSDISYYDASLEVKIEYEEHSKNKEGKVIDEFPQWDVVGFLEALCPKRRDEKESFVKIASQGLEHDFPMNFNKINKKLLTWLW